MVVVDADVMEEAVEVGVVEVVVVWRNLGSAF